MKAAAAVGRLVADSDIGQPLARGENASLPGAWQRYAGATVRPLGSVMLRYQHTLSVLSILTLCMLTQCGTDRPQEADDDGQPKLSQAGDGGGGGGGGGFWSDLARTAMQVGAGSLMHH